MTAFKTVTINCDWEPLKLPLLVITPGRHDGCPGWFETGSSSIPETRREARSSGWSIVASFQDFDLCPRHTAIYKEANQ